MRGINKSSKERAKFKWILILKSRRTEDPRGNRKQVINKQSRERVVVDKSPGYDYTTAL